MSCPCCFYAVSTSLCCSLVTHCKLLFSLGILPASHLPSWQWW